MCVYLVFTGVGVLLTDECESSVWQKLPKRRLNVRIRIIIRLD